MCLRFFHGFAVSVIALTLLAVGSANVPGADVVSCHAQPRAQDTVWLVSSRRLGACIGGDELARLKYWRFDRQRAWTRSGLEEVAGSDNAEVTTVVYLHGNRISSCEAFTQGWHAYRRLSQCADQRPLRFIIWSWPSAKICGPLQDARIKAARTNAHGFYVARFLDHLDGNVPVSMWGFSYGARVGTGALHVLGGGTLGGRRLDSRVHAERQPVRVALLAAALDDGWLLPGRRHGDAPSQVGSMLLVRNGCDRLLARYHWIYGRRCCQEALGYVGLPLWRLPAEDARKIRQIEASCYVGNQHAFANYLASSHVMAQVRDALLVEKPSASEPSEDDVASDTPQVELVSP